MLVSIETFKALAKICDRESSRYALGCILLERSADGSPVAVATDGRRLTSFQWIEPDGHPLATSGPVAGFSALVSAEAVRQVCAWKLDRKILKRRPELGFVFVDENGPAILDHENKPTGERRLPIRATDCTADFTIEHAAGDGRFPKWRDVLPEFAAADCKSITLDPRYVAELCDVARVLATRDDSRGVTFFVRDANSACAMAAELSDGARCTSILMPLASDHAEVGGATFGAYDRARDNRTWAQRIAGELAKFSFVATVEPCTGEPAAVELYSAECATFGRFNGRQLRQLLASTPASTPADRFSACVKSAKIAEPSPVAEPSDGFKIVEPLTGATIGRAAA